MAEDSLAAGRAFIDAFNSTDYDAMRSLMADDIKYEEFGTQRTMSGADEIIDAIQGWKTAMPDVTGDITASFTGGDGDTAAFKLVWNGTHTGPLQTPDGEIPASGKSQSTPGAMVVVASDGKIRHVEQYFDMLTFLQQIGAA